MSRPQAQLAVDELDPATHRAHALAATRLAMLQLATDQLDEGIRTARAALQIADQVRSARLTHSLATLRSIAHQHPDQTTTRDLAAEITTMIGADDTSEPEPDTADQAEAS